MKRLLGGGLAILTLFAGAVRADEAERRQLAEELLTLMNVQASVEQSLGMAKQMIPQQIRQMAQRAGETAEQTREHMGKVLDLVAEELKWEKMKEDYIALYAETFTEQEMRDLIAFFKTPSGQAFVTKQPEVLRRSMAMSQKMLMRLMPKIQALEGELRKNLPPPSPASPQ